MAELTFSNQILGELRRYPPIYRAVRWISRQAIQAPAELLRRLPLRPGRGLARGFYSGHSALSKEGIAGRLVLNEQACRAYPDDSLVGLSGLEQDRNQPWPIFWLRKTEAHLIGSSLALMGEQNLLCAESTFSVTGDKTDPAWWYQIREAPDRVRGNATSIVSRWGHLGYWHWLMDSLPRLAILNEFPEDTKILVPSPLADWMRWFLDELGLSGRYIATGGQNLRVENYYFTCPTAMTGCYNPYAVHFLRKRFLPKMAMREDLPKRFYVIRDGFTRGITNERDVRDFFVARGYFLIAPEQLTFPEQISLFHNAECVVALHGSALTNLVWCSPGCHVLEFSAENFLAGAFEILAHTVGVVHDFLICPADSHFRVTVDLKGLERKLAGWFD